MVVAWLFTISLAALPSVSHVLIPQPTFPAPPNKHCALEPLPQGMLSNFLFHSTSLDSGSISVVRTLASVFVGTM